MEQILTSGYPLESLYSVIDSVSLSIWAKVRGARVSAKESGAQNT